jgi:hydroxyacylglutathione hydrolase
VGQNQKLEQFFLKSYNVREYLEMGDKMPQKKVFSKFLLLLGLFFLISVFNVLPLQPLPGDDSELIKEYKSAKNYLQKGINSFQKGNYKNAEKQFLKCLNKFPQYAEADFFLSQISYQNGDLANALSRIEKAKHNSEIMAKILISAEKEAESQKRAKRIELERHMGVLEAAWENQDAKCALTAAMASTRNEINVLEGQEVVSVAVSSTIPANYFFLHGNIFFRLKDYENARKQYLAVIRIDPKHGEAYNNLANLYYMSHRYDEALDCLNQSISFGVTINENLKAAIFTALGTPDADIMGREFAGGVKRFTLNVGEKKKPFYVNAYVVFNRDTGDAVLIDPGMNDRRIDTFIKSQNLNLLAILNTHGHQDHIGANSYFAEKYDIEIYAHASDKYFYEDNDLNQIPNQFFTTEDSLTFQNLTVKIIHTPGHSDGSCCFLINGALFSGDCLFKGAIGRVWGESTLEQVQKTNQEIENIRMKLCVLPPETQVFPGHDLSTTIGFESKNNSYLNKALAFEILKRTLEDHERVKSLERYTSDNNTYDVKISLSSQQDIESFQKTYGTSVLGLKLYLTVSEQ